MKSPEEGAYWDDYYQRLRMEVLRDSLESTTFHAVYNDVNKYSYREEVFGQWVLAEQAQSALVIGAGVDKIGLKLAARGCAVCSVDLSPKAGELTMRLANETGVANLIECRSLDWERANLGRTFDLIVCHDALHHMNTEPAIKRVAEHLGASGTFLAVEPMCLLGAVRKIHELLPFYPFPKLETERELDQSDLKCIESLLGNVEFRYSDFVTRESLSVLMYRCGLRAGLNRIGKTDTWLLRNISGLARLASYVMVRATRK